jgi:hypothetical protein
MLSGLPPLKVIDPLGVKRVGGEGQIETAWDSSTSAKEFMVGSDELVATGGIDFQVSGNDQHE